MEISVVVQSIMLIALMIFLGAILSRTFPFNNDTRQMFISLIVNVAMPSIILSSIFNVDITKDSFKLIVIVFILSIVINLTGIGLGGLFARIFYPRSKKKAELAILSGLGNTGFIGIPLCAVLIGPEGALFAAIFDAGVDFTIWTVGVFLLQENKKVNFNTLKSMINVPMIAIAIGLTSAYIGFRPPSIVIDLTDHLAALAVPLAMFYIGAIIMSLQRSKVNESSSKIWLPIIVKLIILPISVALMINFIHLEKFIIQTVLIQSMMPTITLASILFAKYSGDEDMGAITTVMSTIVALSTIPLMIYLVNAFIAF
ncbi:MAG TPA: AEC family transporter [Virgibacillus sp.]|nr:AEC family transporter [Virgibacillus sp.]